MTNPTLLARLTGTDSAEKLAALSALDASEATDAVVAAVVDCLAASEKAVQRRAADACQRLAAAGAPIRDTLGAALDSSDARLRWGAAYALSRLGGDPLPAIDAALEAMASDDGDVRWAAAEIVVRIGRLHSGDITARLLEAMRTGPPVQRKMALYCLRDLDGRGNEVLTAAAIGARDGDEGVALAALSILGRLWPESYQARDSAMTLLRADNPRLQRAAASALGRVAPRDPEVDRALAWAANSDDVSLRRAAEQAIRQRSTAS